MAEEERIEREAPQDVEDLDLTADDAEDVKGGAPPTDGDADLWNWRKM
jgi:hypothetical protein